MLLADPRLGRPSSAAIYSFVTHQRLPETQYLYGASVIIVEGILALQDESLRELFDLKGSSVAQQRSPTSRD